MSISKALLPEFDQEIASTRKTLERIHDGIWDFKPHEKSPTLGWLAGHIANLPTWTVMAIGTRSLDMATSPRTPKLANKADLLYAFETNVETAREALESASDECLIGPWSLLNDGKEIFTMPRVALLRSFVMNHLIHHRAQLGVYLRLNDIAVPAIYGPSADESNMPA
jgi:uncharacterized damage-inducible protein DinB